MKTNVQITILLLMALAFNACNSSDKNSCEQWSSGEPCLNITEQIQGLYEANGACGTINIMVVASDSLVNGFKIFLGGVSSQTFIWAELTSETEFTFPLQYVQGGAIEGGGSITPDGLTYTYTASTSGGSFSCIYTAVPNDGAMQNGDAFTATIDGVSWEADLGIDSYVNQNEEYTDLIGVSTDGMMIDILINGEVTVGTYIVDETSQETQITLRTGFEANVQMFSTWHQGASGQVTVSSVSGNRVIGTFTCTLVDGQSPTATKTITEGSFSVTIEP